MPKQPSGPDGSATQRAYHALRGMILSGALGPGEKLKIDTLRDLLDTGASPIREALSLLTSDSLVERIDQRGFRTAEVGLDNFNEILLMRCALEDRALRRSIDNADRDWEEGLVLAHHRMQRARDMNDPGFEDYHKAFHMMLLHNAHAPMLQKLCSQLYDLNIRYRNLAGRTVNYEQRDVRREHTEIMEAAVARDADRASALLVTHYERTGAFLFGLLDETVLVPKPGLRADPPRQSVNGRGLTGNT